jgi:uncharacterized membrane protein
VPTVCCQPPDRTELLSVTICRAEAKISAHLSKLFNLWPAYFAYILSFVMIGIYWAQHHYVFTL